MKLDGRAYRRDCWFGALGALFMLAGDLCLSVIPASVGDSGLFLREAYLSGAYEPWRLPLLAATGLLGMALGFFTYTQITPQYRRTRLAILFGGVIYVASAGALHIWIGTLADWTSTLSPLLGREKTAALIQSQYSRVMPAMGIAYAGMLLLIIGNVLRCSRRKPSCPGGCLCFICSSGRSFLF